MVLEQIANLSLGVIRVLGSSPSRTAKQVCTDATTMNNMWVCS
jgi:hypothetical protein